MSMILGEMMMFLKESEKHKHLHYVIPLFFTLIIRSKYIPVTIVFV